MFRSLNKQTWHHVHHFLRPHLSSYIDRTLSRIAPTQMNAVTWTPAPIRPVDRARNQSAWRAYRVPAGWSLQRADLTDSVNGEMRSDELLLPASLERWFTAFSKKGAGANIGPSSPRSTLGALKIETLNLSLCQERQSPCIFTLTFYEGSHRLIHVERSWDPITLTLSKEHLRRLPEWPQLKIGSQP